MPVEFLSDEQVAAFGRFDGVPSRPELERFFFLDDADLDLIAKRRASHNQLGFALQLGTVRYLGTFLPDPLEVPWPVADYLAAQMGIEDPSVVKRYTERLPTQHEHGREIRDLYGFRDFSDANAADGLREFVAGRAWTHTEGQLALFTQSVAWLRRRRVLLPGASVLATGGRRAAALAGHQSRPCGRQQALGPRRCPPVLPHERIRPDGDRG